MSNTGESPSGTPPSSGSPSSGGASRGEALPGLRDARLDAGLTIRELARSSGVDASTISALERRERGAYPSTARKLAVALGVGVSRLRGGG